MIIIFNISDQRDRHKLRRKMSGFFLASFNVFNVIVFKFERIKIVNACKRVNKQSVIHLLKLLGIYITLGVLYYNFSIPILPTFTDTPFYRHDIIPEN
jgi:hypothetical protein